jgi:hypothetical protein
MMNLNEHRKVNPNWVSAPLQEILLYIKPARRSRHRIIKVIPPRDLPRRYDINGKEIPTYIPPIDV